MSQKAYIPGLISSSLLAGLYHYVTVCTWALGYEFGYGDDGLRAGVMVAEVGNMNTKITNETNEGDGGSSGRDNSINDMYAPDE